MANGKKPVGRPFEKGVSGNPNGRPKTDYRTLEAREETRAHVLAAMHEAMKMPLCDLKDAGTAEANPYASGAQGLMASILWAAIEMGCPKRAAFFMSYLFGRPAEYDPKDDDKAPAYQKSAKAIPSAAIIKALNELNKAEQAAPVD